MFCRGQGRTKLAWNGRCGIGHRGNRFDTVSISSCGAGTFRASNGGEVGDGYVVLSDLRQAAYWASLPSWALTFLISGALVARRRSFPRWLGWSALIIGLALLVAPFIDYVAVWDGATGLAVLWFVAPAVYMLVRPYQCTSPTQIFTTTRQWLSLAPPSYRRR
jgi:hypothetical protein